MATTTKGLRYPVSGDNNNVPTDMQNLATDLDAAIGSFTQTEINAFSAGQKWDGRRVFNTTTKRWQVWNTSSWLNENGYDSTGSCLRLRRASSDSITNGGTDIVSWDTEDADPEGWITVSSQYPTVPSGLGGLYAFHIKAVGSNGPLRRIMHMYVSPIGSPGTIDRHINTPYDDDWYGANTVYFTYIEYLPALTPVSFLLKNNAGYTVNYTATLHVQRLTFGCIA